MTRYIPKWGLLTDRVKLQRQPLYLDISDLGIKMKLLLIWLLGVPSFVVSIIALSGSIGVENFSSVHEANTHNQIMAVSANRRH